ncbi:MAG: universal stress protein [Eggerthella lenta]
MKFTNILVPFDKSDHALHALTLAKGLAEEDPAIKLHVIGVVFVSDIPPALGLDANPYESAPPLVIQPDLYKKLVEAALDREKDDMKHAIGGLLDGMPNDVDIAAVNAPSPVDGINDFAKEHGCDLIVMGSRGLGVLRGMLGSVSYGVLRPPRSPSSWRRRTRKRSSGRKLSPRRLAPVFARAVGHEGSISWYTGLLWKSIDTKPASPSASPSSRWE